jgi:NADH dehydrogenase (ubiquinone) 1 alpha subcomplex subunit 13
LIRELQREKVWSRIHLVPLLLAEGDRDAYRRELAANAREQEIMKDVKGWEVSLGRREAGGIFSDGNKLFSQVGKSVYNDTRYAPADKIIVL